jgi:hypothetical protein
VKPKQPKYDSDTLYKITIVLKSGGRQVKYFKGYEMEEKERLITDKISKIDKYWVEETKEEWR